MHLCTTCGERLDDRADGCSRGHATIRDVPRDRIGPLSGSLIGDRYRLLERLGEGGFGTVYRAVQAPLDRIAAVKILKLDTGQGSDEATARFFQEAKVSSQLEHPHNIRIYDFGEDTTGVLFLAMEFVNGVPLASLPIPMEPERAATIIDQVAAALGEAHRCGLVHRDMKPDNVMVSEVDGRDFVRVLDYGIARVVQSSQRLTRNDMFLGTPTYSAPEQIRARELDGRVDVYAVGVMLYELLVGERPFRAEDPLHVLYQHLHEPPPGLPDHLPTELRALVSRCLAKDPEERPDSMDTVREALRGFVARERHRAGPGGVATRQHPVTFATKPPAANSSTAEFGSERWPAADAGEGGAARRRSMAGLVATLVAVVLVAAGIGLFGVFGGVESEAEPSLAGPIEPGNAAARAPSDGSSSAAADGVPGGPRSAAADGVPAPERAESPPAAGAAEPPPPPSAPASDSAAPERADDRSAPDEAPRARAQTARTASPPAPSAPSEDEPPAADRESAEAAARAAALRERLEAREREAAERERLQRRLEERLREQD